MADAGAVPPGGATAARPRGGSAPHDPTRVFGLEGARSSWSCYCAHNVELHCRLPGIALTPRSPACLEFQVRPAPAGPKSL